MKKILDFLLEKSQYFLTQKRIVVVFLFLGLISFILDSRNKKNTPESQESATSESADTYIPQGMVLIPIEIQNKESLSQILGNYGVVDLYIPSFGEQIKSRKVASGIKIMRAPLNPEVYAVLVKEEVAGLITEFPGPFLVTIQNPKTQKSTFLRKKQNTVPTSILTEI